MINTDVLKDLDNKDVGFYISKIEKNDHTLLENIVEKHLQNLFEIDYINNSKINFSNYLDKVNQKDHQKILTKKICRKNCCSSRRPGKCNPGIT